MVTFNASPAALHSFCKNTMSDCCTCSFRLYFGFDPARYISFKRLSFAICSAITFSVVFSHAFDFLATLMVEVYGIDVPFNVILVGGPLASTLSSSKVPQFKCTSFPLSCQFFCTIVAVINLGSDTFFVVSFVSETVWVAVPPVVILNTCPGYIKLGFLILFSLAICGYFVPLPRYFLAIAQRVSPFLTT